MRDRQHGVKAFKLGTTVALQPNSKTPASRGDRAAGLLFLVVLPPVPQLRERSKKRTPRRRGASRRARNKNN